MLEQYSECIYEKDTDEMVWYPGLVDQCNRKYYLILIIQSIEIYTHSEISIDNIIYENNI